MAAKEKPAENKRGPGKPTKFKTEYIPIVKALVTRGFTNPEIAFTLGVTHRTLLNWRTQHPDFDAAMQRSHEKACDVLEATLHMRAQGFERTVEKATASGKVVVVNEYFPPDVGAAKFMLQHRRPEVFREQREVTQLLGVEQGFLTFLQRLDDKAKAERERGELPQLLEHQPICEIEEAANVEADDDQDQGAS